MYDYQPSVTQTAVVLGVVAILVALACSRIGRPVAPSGERRSRPRWLVAAGAVGMLSLDMVPWSWPGVAVLVLIVSGAFVAIRRRAATRNWSARDIGALAAGALVGRTLAGFLAPAPDGVSLGAKLGQNGVLLAATLVVVWLVAGRDPAPTAASGARCPTARTARRSLIRRMP